MKIFVTGATGLVGSHTARCLYERGHSLRLLVRDVEKAKQWFAQHDVVVEEYIQADMTKSDLIEEAMQGCDAVVHAAAVIDLDATHKEQTKSINQQGLDNIVGTACRLGIKKILYVSSTSSIMDFNKKQLDESFATAHSHEGYSQSKALCEEKVRTWQVQGYPIISTYPTGVIGPDDPKLSRCNEGLLLLYRDIIPLTSSGMQFVDPRDIGKAHALLLEKELAADKTCERYIIGGHYLSWKEFANALNNLGKRKIKTFPIPGALFRGLGCVFDFIRKLIPINYPISHESALFVTKLPYASSDKLFNTIDIHFTPAEQTLADTVAWLEQAGHL